MRRRVAGQSEEASVNITPLLDIVFILLIFFIVTATFTREEGLDLSSPDNNEDQDETVPPPTLVLAVQENGFVRVNNIREIDPRSTRPVVEEFLAQNPEGVVLVNAARTAEAGTTVTVLDGVKAANAEPALTLQREQ